MRANSALWQALFLALISILGAWSCSVVEDSCNSCLTHDQCVAGGCAILVPYGTYYDRAYCSTPPRYLSGDDDEKCTKLYGILGAIVLGVMTSFPLAMTFYAYTKDREAKMYAKKFLSLPTSEVSRAQAVLTKKETLCYDWVGQQGYQSPTSSVRGLKFFHSFFHIEFYTSNQRIAARILCRSSLAFEKYEADDKVEVAYRVGKPQELLLVEDAQMAEQSSPVQIGLNMLLLLMAAAFAGFGFYGIYRWLCWYGYIVLGVIPVVALMIGKLCGSREFLLKYAWNGPLVTITPFTDEAAVIGRSAPPCAENTEV